MSVIAHSCIKLSLRSLGTGVFPPCCFRSFTYRGSTLKVSLMQKVQTHGSDVVTLNS